MDTRAVAVILALVLAPISLVLIVALVRGYDIHLTMTRWKGKR
jgi:hypothetical protein